MNRTFGLLISTAIASTAIALGSLATAVEANAHGRYYGQYGYYDYGYYDVMPRFRESPTYAPDRRPPRSYNNPGRRDFHLGSRG